MEVRKVNARIPFRTQWPRSTLKRSTRPGRALLHDSGDRREGCDAIDLDADRL